MNNIKKLRGKQGYALCEFAGKVGLSKQGLIEIEKSNSKNLKPNTVERICEVLKVSPIQALGEDNFRSVPKTISEIDEEIAILEEMKKKIEA